MMENAHVGFEKTLCMWLAGCVAMVGSDAVAMEPPVNDDCANAIYITDVVDLPFDTTEATFDGDGWCMD